MGRVKRAVHPLVILLSGLACYKIGGLVGCAPELRLATPGDGIEQYSYGGHDPVGTPLYPPRRKSQRRADPDDRRYIRRDSIPYDCGAVFFYHIPSTGGTSINKWFQKYSEPEFGNISYYQYWKLETRRNGTFHPEPERVEAQFAEGMSRHIRNLGPDEWRIAHSHLLSTYLNESEELLYGWRSDVEAQGCQLINAVMLRDPLNHAMSLHKIIRTKNTSRGGWAEYLSSPTGPGLWATVLDFFLYNNHGVRYRSGYPNGPGGRNPFNVSREGKVARAMELLHRHFDIVTVADHPTFTGLILNWTGWAPLQVPRGNVYRRPLQFTKKEVENLQKLLLKNGDTDFVDQAKLDYHDYLSYLAD